MKYKKNFVIFKFNFQNINIKLNKLLTYFLIKFSRKFVFKLIKLGELFVNNNLIKYNIILKSICVVKFFISNILNKIYLNFIKYYLPIIYEDNYILIVFKPSGIVVHPCYYNWDNTLINYLLYYFGKKLLNLFRYGILHRLDKFTSGIVLLYKFNFIYLNFLKQNKINIFNKYYLSLNFNYGFTKQKIIGYNNLCYKRKLYSNLNLFSITNVICFRQILFKNYKFSLIKSSLITGRTHQLRIHFNYFNFPIIGDKIYNNLNIKNLINRQFLHCYSFNFFHPIYKIYNRFIINLASDIYMFYKYIFRDGGIWTLDSNLWMLP